MCQIVYFRCSASTMCFVRTPNLSCRCVSFCITADGPAHQVCSVEVCMLVSRLYFSNKFILPVAVNLSDFASIHQRMCSSSKIVARFIPASMHGLLCIGHCAQSRSAVRNMTFTIIPWQLLVLATANIATLSVIGHSPDLYSPRCTPVNVLHTLGGKSITWRLTTERR